MKKRARLICFVIGAIIIGIAIIVTFFLKQDPLAFDGFTEDQDRTKVLLSLINKGSFKIKIQEVKVDNQIPTHSNLVMSYSGQLALSGGIYSDDSAKFVGIDDASILPALKTKEERDAVKLKTRLKSYALFVENSERVTYIKIQYTYLGIHFVKKVNLDTWPEYG